MFVKFFCLYIFAHILGDFYFQTEKMAQNKKTKFSWVVLHSVVYAFFMILAALPFLKLKYFCVSGILAVSHFIIDAVKFFIQKKSAQNKTALIFISDQIVHFACIFAAAVFMDVNHYELVLPDFFYRLSSVVSLSIFDIFRWITALLFVGKPCGILIQNLTSKFKPVDSVNQECEIPAPSVEAQNAGKTIGYLERFIILVLISLKQYSAIGLVLTAKSIARYNKITSDKSFSEYYLLGTLLSLGSVIVSAIFFLMYMKV